ncbi:hypothetical protein HanRHA438_Chr08g0364611 [Helianthus annuus]|uniref:Uncharacterized protein n=1 Tax=Helianthus annuus TaxID=4232 RepID=A0A9K3IGW9_HELAN|nr:hypothetical protein HanXRQr2_Chr08g0352451 [Helianthus annuus]KAJ0899112.1 hypothetical protein HanRHA438_Chr08g0364611 [Helianthus annuus]KAJ0902718.1 hypothetical protein HanPSC8_Chr08g0340391 [Helianthus annuus]
MCEKYKRLKNEGHLHTIVVGDEQKAAFLVVGCTQIGREKRDFLVTILKRNARLIS